MSKHNRKPAHEQADTATTNDQEDTMLDTTTNATEGAASAYAAAVAALPPVEVKFNQMGDLTVALPRRYTAGYVLANDSEGMILDMAIVRQFTNNMNANAKARAERLAAAEKAGDEAKIAANQPYTAEEVAALFADYKPNVGGAPRESAVQKLRYEAAWRVWVEVVNGHNKLIDAGQPGILKSPARVQLISPPRKGFNLEGTACSAEDHETALEEFASMKRAFLDQILAHADYAERVQKTMDQITAERAKKAPTAAPKATLAAMGGLL